MWYGKCKRRMNGDKKISNKSTKQTSSLQSTIECIGDNRFLGIWLCKHVLVCQVRLQDCCRGKMVVEVVQEGDVLSQLE
jgi:hypothetical protein